MSDRPPPASITSENFRKIREVFESALERPASERQAFIEKACGADLVLVHEVQRMLAAEDQTNSARDHSVRTPVTSLSCAARSIK